MAPSQGDHSLTETPPRNLQSWMGAFVLLLPHSFIYSLITQSFDKYSLSAHDVPGTVPRAGEVSLGSWPPCQGPSPPSVAWASLSGLASPDTKETKSQANWIPT